VIVQNSVSHIIPNGLLQSNKYLFIGPFCHGVGPFKYCFPIVDEGSVAQVAMWRNLLVYTPMYTRTLLFSQCIRLWCNKLWSVVNVLVICDDDDGSHGTSKLQVLFNYTADGAEFEGCTNAFTMHSWCWNMRFDLRTLPIHCQIWILTIDMLQPQICRAYLEFAWDINPYCPLELRICTPDIF
jgi:hypothetical protein